jgi:hypothetical protein
VFGVSWNCVRKVATAVIGLWVDRHRHHHHRAQFGGARRREIGQIDLTCDMTRFVQLRAPYARTFARTQPVEPLTTTSYK